MSADHQEWAATTQNISSAHLLSDIRSGQWREKSGNVGKWDSICSSSTDAGDWGTKAAPSTVNSQQKKQLEAHDGGWIVDGGIWELAVRIDTARRCIRTLLSAAKHADPSVTSAESANIWERA